MVAERPRPSRSEIGSAMARPRRSRSLREELAEAEKLAENDNEKVQEEAGVHGIASVNTPIRPRLKSVPPQRTSKHEGGEKRQTPRNNR